MASSLDGIRGCVDVVCGIGFRPRDLKDARPNLAVKDEYWCEMELALERGESAVVSGIGRVAVRQPSYRPGKSVKFSSKIQTTRALSMGLLLCTLQALDGVLTSVGVSRYGIAIEGNPLIRSLMHDYGSVVALGLVKTLAIAVVLILTFYARKIPWVNNAMGAVAGVYVFAAIIPWTYILLTN